MRWMALSIRLYRVLLLLYPVEFRDDYGLLMVQLFRDVLRDRYRQHGLVGAMLWWSKTLLDLTITVIEQRRKANFTMGKSSLVQQTGMYLVIGGVLVSLSAFSQLQPGENTTYSGLYQVLFLLIAPGFLFVGLGINRLSSEMGKEGSLGAVLQWTLFLSEGGTLVMAVGAIVMVAEPELSSIWRVGSLIYVAGLMLFGLAHVWKPVLPIFRALPLQLAAGWLVVVLDILPYEQGTIYNMLSFLFVIGTGLAWLAIGQTLYRLETDALPTAT